MKATEQYFPVVLFVMLYKVVLTFESVDETPKCNQSYCAARSSGAAGLFFIIVQKNTFFFHCWTWGLRN